ncbi:glycosyltransferase family 4 protein [Leptothoe spongobia]|uniref:Glycosyltransferase family 4 protein n=1 Tax=Leptothoe spongobia TAU-MAC 1115 TaxID=1967444 RepID=A0A947DE41_9CYAN|nr:glycosyltransferase family 4 protein [Leptothoe spongobia]MBT9315200.1 glycosyltransferase family 4 protein [Leptothoe spongobia TAU-MAC 1115]
MNILFLHQNFPAQFRHLASTLAKDPQNTVVFGTTRKNGSIAGVNKVIYQPTRQPHPDVHYYVRPLESAVLEGQAVYRVASQLKERHKFEPDIVYAHSGWGPGLFMKDLFPNSQYLCFFEWFYHAHGSDTDFDPAFPCNEETEAKLRIRNAPILIDLYSCDRGLTPTHWQQQQFPPEYHNKLTVCHDGIDTNFFRPKSDAKLVIKPTDPIACPSPLDLSEVDEIVTYVARGMEPYRGFPQFMEVVEQLQQNRPQCHVVIVGEDRVAYGSPRKDGKTYREHMLEQLDLDLTRIHFTGHLSYKQYLIVLQASSVHVYLTYPFVLSWSMLEALSTGCVVVGSKTQPVEEVIQDGVNGILVDFFDTKAITEKVNNVLDHPEQMQMMRERARQTIVENYNLDDLLKTHLAWMQGQ